jgi:monoamine oxidase
MFAAFNTAHLHRRTLLKGGLASAALTSLGLGSSSIKAQAASGTVLVIGAGVAGLAAANKLKAAGFTVIVLEARFRTGGRVWTDRAGLGYACDMGAGWIHGPDGGNPVTSIAQQANAATFLTPDSSVQVFDASGADVTATQAGVWDPRYRDLLPQITEKANAATGDISVQEAINRIDPTHLTQPYMIYPLSAYGEFDAGGPIDLLSGRNWLSDSKFPGKDVLFPSGYDAVTNQLGVGLDVRFGQRVSAIDTSGSEVRVTTSGGTYTANHVVCTLPLGVLKSGSVTFTPALPSYVQSAIDRVKMGYVNKVFCDFENAFWPTDTQYFGAHTAEKGMLNYWLSYRKFSNINCLVGLAVGNAGLLLEALTDAEIMGRTTSQLRTMFGSATPAPRKINISRWTLDPLSGGSYSFAGVGSSPEDFGTLGSTISGKLYFAGEHTSTSYRGTVHGAYLEGMRAAEAILGSTGTSLTTFTPQSGWWWNAAESGRGFFIEIKNGTVFMAGYVYEVSGTPTWFVSAGSLSGSAYTGTMQTFTGGQTLTGSYKGATRGADLGNLSLQFLSATTATMTWPGGTTSLVRFPFGSGAAPQVESGWWWNPAESGRGFSLECQGSSLFIAGYMYTDTGKAIWYIASGALSASNVFVGQWAEFVGGQTIGGPYQAPTLANANVGSMQLAFSGPRSGVLTLPDGRTTSIERFL